MPHILHLCDGVRVLLTHNEWVEAGLMNGALGYVRGFVWPEGGNPNARGFDNQAELPYRDRQEAPSPRTPFLSYIICHI